MAGHETRRKHPDVELAPGEAATNRHVTSLALAGYVFYMAAGVAGSLFPRESFGQAMSWQLSTAGAIGANVLAGIWLARRGDDLAAAGFTLLGIVQCVFFSSIVVTVVDYRAGAGGALLMVPSMILIAFCTLFPLWVRLWGLLTSVLFALTYVTIITGTHRAVDALQIASYVSVQILGVIWGVYFVRAGRRRTAL